MAITYRKANTKRFKMHVVLDGRIVGAIKQTVSGMFFYQPRGSSETGEVFATLTACKASIEPHDEIHALHMSTFGNAAS